LVSHIRAQAELEGLLGEFWGGLQWQYPNKEKVIKKRKMGREGDGERERKKRKKKNKKNTYCKNNTRSSAVSAWRYNSTIFSKVASSPFVTTVS
jgi:hypothetical protein